MTYGFNTDAGSRTIVCPTCGLRYPVSAKFCGQDGTILTGLAPTVGPVSVGGPKHCPTCKTVYPSYAVFCPSDAQILVISTPTAPTAPVPTHAATIAPTEATPKNPDKSVLADIDALTGSPNKKGTQSG